VKRKNENEIISEELTYYQSWCF